MNTNELTEQQKATINKKKIDCLMKIQSHPIFKNTIYTNHNGKRYILTLNDYQLKQFKEDFAPDNYSYNYSFWLRAVFLLGTCVNIDIPE